MSKLWHVQVGATEEEDKLNTKTKSPNKPFKSLTRSVKLIYNRIKLKKQ